MSMSTASTQDVPRSLTQPMPPGNNGKILPLYGPILPLHGPNSNPINSNNQIGGGPAGILYTLSNELTVIYNQLQSLYNSMTIAETKVQETTINAGAKAQVADAHFQMVGLIIQGLTSFGGSIAGGIASYRAAASEGENEKINTNENTIKNLTDVSNKVPPQALQDVSVGDNPIEEDNDPRKAAMLNGSYTFEESAAAHPKEMEKNIVAMSKMNDTELGQLRASLERKMAIHEDALNTVTNQINTRQSRFQSFGQMATSGINALGQGGQASTTLLSGEAKAAQQVDGSTTQMVSSTVQDTKQNIAQFYAKIAELISAARQGSNTYAQT